MRRTLPAVAALLALACTSQGSGSTSTAASSGGGRAPSTPGATPSPGSEDDADDPDDHDEPGGRVVVVNPGDSIQAAVDAAGPGDAIHVRPGTYHETGRPCPDDAARTCAVVVGQDGIRLVGVTEGGAGPVLEAAGAQDRGIAFARSGAQGATCLADAGQRLRGVAVEGFTVRGFADDGIFLFCVDDWRVAGNIAEGNGEYGIFPSHCGKGRVTRNLASGANDTGIYVGQSHDVRVDRNVAHDNVSGFEIENSSHVRLDHNVATGNTGGILTFTLPNLDVKANQDNVIEDNVVTSNDKANSCVSGDVCLVPVGTGILALAVDRNVIRRNVIVANATAGIALFDFCTALGLDAPSCAAAAPDIDPLPDGNRIVGNVALDNGGNPDTARLPPGVPGGDLLWSGAGTGNCWKGNVARAIVSPVPLPTCG